LKIEAIFQLLIVNTRKKKKIKKTHIIIVKSIGIHSWFHSESKK